VAYTSFPILFSDPDNRYQNIREYLGLLLGMLLLRAMFPHEKAVLGKWVNDNTAALAWADSAKYSSTCGQAANIVMNWFQIYSGINIIESEHIPGVDMGIIDDISRDVKNRNLDSTPFVNLQSPLSRDSEHLKKIFGLCDPTVGGTIKNHHDMFFEIHSVLNSYFNL